MAAVCRAGGLSKSEVYADARGWSARPREVVDRWCAVQVAATRELEWITWETVGSWAGDASLSTVSDLVRRRLGHRPSRLLERDADGWPACFERAVLKPVLGGEGRS